jgi:hypothetical protein
MTPLPLAGVRAATSRGANTSGHQHRRVCRARRCLDTAPASHHVVSHSEGVGPVSNAIYPIDDFLRATALALRQMLYSPDRKSRPTARLAAHLALAGVCFAASSAIDAAAVAARQQPAISEKESRTPAQRKINSQVLYEIYRRRGEAERKGVPPGPTGVEVDARGRALVDVRAEVTPALERTIRSLGGTILSRSPEHHSIVARLPLLKLEELAGVPAVRFIEPVAKATTNRRHDDDL